MQDEDLQSPEQLEAATGQPGGQAIPPAEPGEFQQMLSYGLIGLGSVMMILVIIRLLKRSTKARNSRDFTAYTSKSPRPHDESPAPAGRSARANPLLTDASAAKARLEHVMADGEELTRRLAAILDNKAARIETLIEHADQRLAALAEAEERARNAPAPQPAPAQPTSRPQPEPPAPLSIDPLHRKVYELADKGATPVEIARQIDRPTGQIELILALRRA